MGISPTRYGAQSIKSESLYRFGGGAPVAMGMESFRLHLGDARELAWELSEGSLDVTITSPPYAEMKDYGVKGQIGYGQDYETEYLPDLKRVFEGIYRATSDTGSLWLVVDTFKQGGRLRLLPFDMARVMEKVGWKLQDIMIWNKGKTLPWSRKGQLRNVHEYILLFSATQDFKYYIDSIKEPESGHDWWITYPERYSPKGTAPSNIWNYTIPTQGSWGGGFLRHFCPFPTEMVERILLLSSDEGDIVCDPFAGSGVVLAQADCMNRRWIGFELNSEYVKAFEKQVLPAIRGEWKERKHRLQVIEERQRTYEKDVRRLRQLKFPKTLVKRLFQKKGYTNETFCPNSVFVIPREMGSDSTDKYKIMRAEFVLVFDSPYESKLEGDIDDLISRPPLSKFGIVAKTTLMLRSEFKEFAEGETSISDKQLWLYAKGVTHRYDSGLSLKEWLTLSLGDGWKAYHKNGIPPVVSPIKVFKDGPTRPKEIAESLERPTRISSFVGEEEVESENTIQGE